MTGTAPETHATGPAIAPPPTPVAGIMAWLVSSAALAVIGVVLLRLLWDLGILVYIGSGVSSGTLAAACFAVSFAALVVFLLHAGGRAGDQARWRWLVFVIDLTGGMIGLAAALAAALAVMTGVGAAPEQTAGIVSPDGQRSVLLTHQSFLLLGSVHAYAPDRWPVHREFGGFPVDDGIFPLAEGGFTVEWDDDALIYRRSAQIGPGAGPVTERIPLPAELRRP